MKNICYELIEKYNNSEKKGREAELEILAGCDDSSIYTALNPDRADVIECYPWKSDDKVLCLGAVYGAYDLLAERVGRLDIADPADEKLELARIRCDKNAAAGHISFIKEAADSDYDAVIADITSSDEEWELKGDKAAFIRHACSHLKKGGTLIFIADNADALRFKAGIVPEHAELLVSRDFAESIKELCGFAGIKRYYPLPNAAFAKNIYSDSFMPDGGSFKDISEHSYEERLAVFSEGALYGSLCGKGYFADYAPSFAYVYTGYGIKDGAAADERSLSDYIRFNRTRNERYAIKTELFISENADAGRISYACTDQADAHSPAESRADNAPADTAAETEAGTRTAGGRFVRKTALTKAANAHIESFESKYKLLKDSLSDRAEAVIPHTGRNDSGLSYADFEYIEGRELGSMLADKIVGGRAPIDELEAALFVILGDASTECHNMDALFENVIADADGRYHFIDYEWVYDEPIDRAFVRFRILSYWYDAYKTELYAYADKNEFLKELGADISKISEYDRLEKEFQESVSCDAAEAEISSSFRAEEATPQLIREQKQRISELTEWNLRLQDEIEEHKTALSKEREVERLSQNHIRNIERINAAQKSELAVLSEQNAYLIRHQSVSSRLKRKAIAAIDAWAPAESNKRRLIHYAKNTVLHPGRQLKLYFTADGRRYIRGDFSIGGEFAEGGLLTLPKTDKPLVSIVIPAYNQVAYTYACIRSIIDNTDSEATPYEVILADDVSTDATKEIGDYIANLIVSRNSSNMGFLRNCNQAADKARGRYILFLNNDTKVHKEWLSSLVELAASDDSIGMVGSKLVYPDGRLQEAGGIIWSDASGWNYGRLDDPDKPEYNYVKDVDYISGAAIMIKTELWKEIGGFDDYFAPAYCEDSDLAFEVRKHGRRVVYQPKSVVTHFEGISNGTDVQGTGLKRYQIVNQEKFKTKWAEELKLQSVNTGNPDPFAARDRSQGKPCVVVIDHYVPTWDKDAGSKTTYQYMKMFLKKGFNVKFIGDNFLHEEPYTSELEQLGVEVLYGTEYRDSIYDYLKKNSGNIDFCYLNRPHIAVKYIDFLKKNTDIKCIFYGHDLHYLRILREYELTGEIRKKRESDYWRSVEFSVMEQADMVYYPSEVEIEAIHKYHPEIPAKAITAYVWDSFKPNDASEEGFKRKEGLLFVGGFKHPPNADAVKWFASRIMPRIRERIPDIRFYVAGSGADEDVLELNNSEEGIDILGFVSDERLAELYAKTRLTVVPLRYGAGVKGKVVEAIYNNTAVITTSVGAEGIPDAENAMVVVDDDPEKLIENSEAVEGAFADKLVELYLDPAACAAMSAACSGFIREHYSIDAAWSVIEEDFR